MNQEERRIYLIDALLKEHSEYQTIDIPEDKDSQKLLLRDLMNIREPKRINKDFLQIQDEYLQEETKEKGIVDCDELDTLTRSSLSFFKVISQL